MPAVGMWHWQRPDADDCLCEHRLAESHLERDPSQIRCIFDAATDHNCHASSCQLNGVSQTPFHRHDFCQQTAVQRRRNAISVKRRKGESPAGKKTVSEMSCNHHHHVHLQFSIMFYFFPCQHGLDGLTHGPLHTQLGLHHFRHS
jgi:hypothetical protein